MDILWFKKQQRRAGITSEDIAKEIRKDRSVISKILNGKQRMTLEVAAAFAKLLNVPLAEVLSHAGIADPATARRVAPGFSGGDAVPYVPKTPEAGDLSDHTSTIARDMGGGRPGIDIWTVDSDAMMLAGYLPGDRMLVNTHAALAARAGDTVLAQVYDHVLGSATTVLRRLEPPALVAATADPAKWRPYIVDGTNVTIMGKVIASWRQAQ